MKEKKMIDLRSQTIRRTPEELVNHMNSFSLNLRFSAGIWCFNPANSRFHEKYSEDLNIEQRLEIAAGLKDYGLCGLEAHYPNEINEKNIDIWKKFERDVGIKLITIIPLLFWDKDFKWGSLSNPIPEMRSKAIQRLKETLRLNIEMRTEFAILWCGIDGYENPFGLDFVSIRSRFIEGLVEAMDEIPGVRIAIEPKPYEPRGHIIFGTTAEGMLLCHQVESILQNSINIKLLNEGHKLCCLNPEVGHVFMAYEDLPYAYSLPLSEGRLAHIHINSQPLGNYDQDLNVGVVGIEQMEALMYVLKMHSYCGWFGIDINSERMPIDTAIKINIDAVRASNDLINSLDHESIIFAVNNPEKAKGWLEAYLIRARAKSLKNISPLVPHSFGKNV